MKIFRKDSTNNTIASGGVAIITQDKIHAEEIQLNSELEAIAISAYIPQKTTICSIYLLPNKTFEEEDLHKLIESVPEPFIITGDFNSHGVL